MITIYRPARSAYQVSSAFVTREGAQGWIDQHVNVMNLAEWEVREETVFSDIAEFEESIGDYEAAKRLREKA